MTTAFKIICAEKWLFFFVQVNDKWTQSVMTHNGSRSSSCPGWSCHSALVHLKETGEWLRTLATRSEKIAVAICRPVLTQPAYEGLSHQSRVPQVPDIRVKVIEHRPVGPTHHATVELCYFFAQRQEPGSPTTPLLNLRRL